MIAPFTFAACLALSPGSAQIVARDLAPAWPAVRAVAPDTPIAPVPMPGVTRVFHPTELRQLAARWHVDPFSGSRICLALPVRPPDPRPMLEAMRQAWPGVSIEILDFSRQPAPVGPMEFPKSALRREAGAALWNGWISYAGNRRFRIWARVQVTRTVSRVVAKTDLQPGRPIAESQISLMTRQEFPADEPFAQAVSDVVGRWPRRPIAAGSELRTDQLGEPRVVAMGDAVEVEVRNGGALLRMEGTAESAGAVGEMVTVRNPSSRQLIRARVTGPGRVAIDTAPGSVAALQSGKESNP